MLYKTLNPYVALLIITVIASGLTYCLMQTSNRIEIEDPLPVAVRRQVSSGLDTSNWKTYRSEKYGFEFKYPASVFTKVNAEEKDLSPESPVKNTQVFEGISREGNLDISVADKTLDPQKETQILLQSVADSIATTTIGNQTAYMYSTGNATGAAMVVFTDVNGRTLTLSFNRETVAEESPQPIYNDLPFIEAILSTFKFTSPNAVDTADWKTYRDEKYSYEIQYPEKGWFVTSKFSTSALSYTPILEPVNLYTARDVPTQGPISSPVTVAVYEKPSTPISEWLSADYGVDLSKIERGGVDTTLAKAYAGDYKPHVLTYNESDKNGVTIYEVGRTWSTGEALNYATFFVKENLPYVYEVSFHLPDYGALSKAQPSDIEYIEMYKEIVSTFKFTQ